MSRFKIQRKPFDGLTMEEAEQIRKKFDVLEQKNAKLVEALEKIAGVKLGGHLNDSVMANHMILEAQKTLAEVKGEFRK